MDNRYIGIVRLRKKGNQMTSQVEKMTFTEALLHKNYAYARAKSWRLSGIIESDDDYNVFVYHWDKESPSGVILAAVQSGLKEAVAMMDAVGRPFPLSPTEAR